MCVFSYRFILYYWRFDQVYTNSCSSYFIVSTLHFKLVPRIQSQRFVPLFSPLRKGVCDSGSTSVSVRCIDWLCLFWFQRKFPLVTKRDRVHLTRLGRTLERASLSQTVGRWACTSLCSATSPPATAGVCWQTQDDPYPEPRPGKYTT